MGQKLELAPGYIINRVLNGCWQLSLGHSLDGALDMDDVMKAFRMLYEHGFTTFDVADIYTGAEDFIGEFVKVLKKEGIYTPDCIQVHTKYVPDINMLADVDFAYTESIIDRSLQRLNREILDVVQFHWWDYEVPGMIETACDLVRLQEKGKIRHVSVTNFDTPHLKMLVDAGIKILSCQAQYSVFDRRPEKRLIEYCKENGIWLICYGTLAGGFLSGKYLGMTREQFVPETRSQVKYLQVLEDSYGWDGYQALLKMLKEIADAHGVSISNVATKYILEQEQVAAAVIGVRNSRHVDSNAAIFSFELSEEEMRRIRTYVEQNSRILEGEPFELERTPGSRYRGIMHMNINKEEN